MHAGRKLYGGETSGSRGRHTGALISTRVLPGCVVSLGFICKTEAITPTTPGEDGGRTWLCAVAVGEGIGNIGPLSPGYSQTPVTPPAPISKEKAMANKPHHGSGAPLATTPFLIPSSPFLPFTHHFSSGRPGWGKASLAQHNFPRPRSLDRSEP